MFWADKQADAAADELVFTVATGGPDKSPAAGNRDCLYRIALKDVRASQCSCSLGSLQVVTPWAYRLGRFKAETCQHCSTYRKILAEYVIAK